MDQLLRIQNFTVSSDGFGAGEGQSLERPFGHADPGALMTWALATASFPNRAVPGGSRGLDDYFTRDFAHGIGAEMMGRKKFGPQRGTWEDHERQGWWGAEPPFHTPVFVMTHHPRPSFTLSDTTFHFVDADPATALDQAREAAQGGGGTSDSEVGPPSSGSSSTPTSSTRCTWRSHRWSSAPAYGSGPHPTSCSTASTSTSCPARGG
ncbi:hypothetical protein [Blastococcus saxobsidens]|uniref:Putative Dihydrofolate reductase n=1 Tax=Blastococcus saxobsidens (strain DD2) TaxID=1146883 RepID=H6RRA7_BLASD|nr:hypothetical protein [Blastococcus saxobsidens]CCG04187.1 Putative Dihydrofolate reductase [Blastococcus saxobsidens DD2]